MARLRRTVLIFVLGSVLSTSLALTYYYGGIAPEARNRIVAAGWGIVIGFPSAAAIVLRIGDRDDNHKLD